MGARPGRQIHNQAIGYATERRRYWKNSTQPSVVVNDGLPVALLGENAMP